MKTSFDGRTAKVTLPVTFFGEERLRLKQTGAKWGWMKMAKVIGSAWRSLSSEEKKPQHWGNLPRVNATLTTVEPIRTQELDASRRF
ncbi:hypothetical protein R1flu_023467 [Riccia fluitans]|uniref:Uncharacterized protein n=1 Tax=Riccia fluitans TaxID=41844 RepID=A0ABD1XS44_9MARC